MNADRMCTEGEAREEGERGKRYAGAHEYVTWGWPEGS